MSIQVKALSKRIDNREILRGLLLLGSQVESLGWSGGTALERRRSFGRWLITIWRTKAN